MIRAQGVGKQAGGRWLVRGVDLEVRPGEFLALVGPNGAGKSTLLKLLSGEEAAHEGSVTWDGRGLSALEWARQRAVLAQGTPRAPGLRVDQTLALGRLPHRGQTTAGLDRTAVESALARTGLGPLADHRFETLSGGEAQLAAFARGLVQLEGVDGSRFYFLDEPTSALDLAHQLALLGHLADLVTEGVGVVCVIHDLNWASRFADRVAVLSQGRLVALGPPAEAINEALVETVFATRARVIPHPEGGHPLVLPLEGLRRPSKPGGGRPSCRNS